jgi:hypothetical protein
MWVLAIYVAIMFVFDVVDYFIGIAIADFWSDAIALPVFLSCYFLTLWIAWVIAVRIAESMKLEN